MNTSRARQAAAAAVLLLVLAGCAGPEEDPGVIDGSEIDGYEIDGYEDYLAAEAALLGVIEATQAAAGGSWETPRTSVMECPLPVGGAGARLSYASVARGSFDPDAAFAAAQPVWAAAGLSAREGDPLMDSRMFYAEGPAGLIIELGVGPAAQTIAARSDCVRADAGEINRYLTAEQRS